jgi:broad specificity phosphatase PhoE
LQRSIQTASHFSQLPITQWSILNEINAGICEGMTYKEIEEKYPEEFRARSKDKFNYRYPKGK